QSVALSNSMSNANSGSDSNGIYLLHKNQTCGERLGSLNVTDPPLTQRELPAPVRDALPGHSLIARQYLSQVRAVSLKCQLRLPGDIKRSVCKRCDSLLIPGSTCTEETENKSRGRKKPWADVLIVQCNTCGSSRRYPKSG